MTYVDLTLHILAWLYLYRKTVCFFFLARRDLPLGIEDYKIRDRSLSASSEWNRYHGAQLGRLNTVARGRNKGAWSAKRNNRRQWIMVSARF